MNWLNILLTSSLFPPLVTKKSVTNLPNTPVSDKPTSDMPVSSTTAVQNGGAPGALINVLPSSIGITDNMVSDVSTIPIEKVTVINVDYHHSPQKSVEIEDPPVHIIKSSSGHHLIASDGTLIDLQYDNFYHTYAVCDVIFVDNWNPFASDKKYQPIFRKDRIEGLHRRNEDLIYNFSNRVFSDRKECNSFVDSINEKIRKILKNKQM